MLRVYTDSANTPPARNAIVCLEAVTLVVNHPGCTLGELVSLTLTKDEQGDELRHEAARSRMLPALHQAVMRGHLVNGPQRECRERQAMTSIWLPGETLNMPLLPARGLRGLVLRAHTVVAQLAAEEALA
jgi:hypothetical protein